MEAARWGRAECVQLLMSFGATVDTKNKVRTLK